MTLLHDSSSTDAAEARIEPSRARKTAVADRSWLAAGWYRVVCYWVTILLSSSGGLRATGRRNVPGDGAVILVANHLSHLDVFVLAVPLNRPLNFVARSTLFKPVLGPLIRSLGAFPIQREGMGVSGVKETLKRLRAGCLITFFPEGTRSRDGELAPLKPGIAVLAGRAKVPVVPVGIAGTFESWPRTQLLPRPHAVRIHYGTPIPAEAFAGLDPDQITSLIRTHMDNSLRIAREDLARDLKLETARSTAV